MTKSNISLELDRIEALIDEDDFSPELTLKLALINQVADKQVGKRLLGDWRQRFNADNASKLLLDNSAMTHVQLKILRQMAGSKWMEHRWLCCTSNLDGEIFEWLIQIVHPQYRCFVEAVKNVDNEPKMQWQWLNYTVCILCEILPEKNLIQNNINGLGDILQLSDIEKRLVYINLARYEDYNYSQHVSTLLGDNNPVYHLARLLKVSASKIDKALASNGVLRTCLMATGNDIEFDINSRVANLLCNKTPLTERRLTGSVLSQLSQGILKKHHFDHLTISPILEYIKVSLKSRKAGVNILLYGPPGTGKTQLTKCIAKACKATLLSTDIAQYPSKKNASRFNQLSLANRLMHRINNSILCVDECEDVFENSPFIDRRHSKQQLNMLLEDNPVPIIWITNTVEAIDPAHLRRFDIVMAVEPPLTKQKEVMFAKELATLNISETLIKTLASHEYINQAHVNSAAKVALALGYKGGKADELVTNLLNEQLKPMGIELLKHGYQSETTYQPTLVNLKGNDLTQIKQSLISSREGRLLLYGPPGSGKTGFAYHLSESSGIPLIHVRASDLLDKYVGETEQKIAKVFNQACKEKSILLLDEVDSLLRDRNLHQQSWETSQVNELLTQMECFQGILIASTNFDQRLDPAVARRFDFKLHFGFLKPAQATLLFKQVTGALDLPNEIVSTLNNMPQLTPGDFAVVKRKIRLSGSVDLTSCLCMLQQEHDYKTKKSSKPIGFVA